MVLTRAKLGSPRLVPRYMYLAEERGMVKLKRYRSLGRRMKRLRLCAVEFSLHERVSSYSQGNGNGSIHVDVHMKVSHFNKSKQSILSSCVGVHD